MTPLQKEVYEAVQSGLTIQEAADKFGISFECARSRYRRADAWIEVDPAIKNAMNSVGTNMVPSVVWDKSNPKFSVMLKPQQENKTDDLLDRVASAFASIPAYKPKPVALEDNDLLVVYPMYDLHAGMLADAEETRGPDYDLTLFKSDLLGAVARLNRRVPSSGHALIILGGDTIHTNDYTNETPNSAHKLDADSRFEKITDIAIEAISHAIEEIASRHALVSVVVLRGNHDESSHIVLKAGLKQRYRNSNRIQFPVLQGAKRSEIFWTQHGNVMIAAHHGDKMKPEGLAMLCADRCRFWSDTRTRVILTGHLHHLRVKDMPGVTHYTMRAFAPADAYGANFGGVRGLQAMVFDSSHGLIAQFHDGVWRE